MKYLTPDALIVGVVATAVFAGSGVAVCYNEFDDCTVCYHAGARIPCSTGGGVISCPDDILSSDPPFRKVLATLAPGQQGKRSENYGSCKWQPMKRNPNGDVPYCVPDGDVKEELNVMGEETYGDPCPINP